MKLIKLTFIALLVAIFLALSLIMLWFDVINLVTSIISLVLILAFGGISYLLATLERVEKELKILNR